MSAELVRKALIKMKCGKAAGPSGIIAEMLKAAGEDDMLYCYLLDIVSHLQPLSHRCQLSFNSDMESLGMSQKDAQSRNKWRRKIKGATG